MCPWLVLGLALLLRPSQEVECSSLASRSLDLQLVASLPSLATLKVRPAIEPRRCERCAFHPDATMLCAGKSALNGLNYIAFHLDDQAAVLELFCCTERSFVLFECPRGAAPNAILSLPIGIASTVVVVVVVVL